MKLLTINTCFLASLILFFGTQIKAQSIDEKVDSLVTIMSLEEKIGQMTQVERTALENDNDITSFHIGSLLSGGGSAPSPNNVNIWGGMYDYYQEKALTSNLGIPLIYGIDAVHGHNNVYGAVIFPHNIGMGCTWNPELIQKANEVVAKEVTATGIDWTFAPCIAVPRNERWGRTYEGFGETVEIQKIMADASVRGLQGTNLSADTTILACAKHFVGDGGTTNGTDQGDAEMTEQELKNLHMEGYIDAIEAGVGSVMASYNSWNGEKLHGDSYMLSYVLKNQLGFDGFVVSDWKGVDQVDEDYREAIKRSINAGIDMVMVPDRYEVFIGHLISLVEDGEVDISRIDDAVRRILKQKFLLDLFEKPYTNTEMLNHFATQENRDIARQVVRESMVLLDAKNDVLPLQKNNQKILIAGTLADDLGAQCGGWSISWQGNNGNITQGTSILEGFEELTESTEIIYSESGETTEDVDIAVVVIGEKTPYAEGAGDSDNLILDAGDVNLVKNLKEKGIPVVAVLISGRPMVFGELLPYTDAVFTAWYPGSEGDGIAEVLFGDYEPKGVLTHTWAKNMAQIPINWGDENYNPLYAYLHGVHTFPTAENQENITAYAGTTDITGTQVFLKLNNDINSTDFTASDFQIYVNGIENNIISSIEISTFDESMLVFYLNTSINTTDEISISHTGNTIGFDDLMLENFDDLFVYNAINANYIIHSIPGRIEAEDYFEMSGIDTETCTDTGGGLNVGYIDVGDFMKYAVNIAQSGTYNVTTRIAGYDNGQFRLSFDNGTQTNVSYTPTSGWQTWADFDTEIYLESGTYEMQFTALNSYLNINYFDFELQQASSNTDLLKEDITIFPNPAKGQFTINFDNPHTQELSIRLIDLSGKMNKPLFKGILPYGKNSPTFELDNNLSAGTYFIEIKDNEKRYFKKLIIEK